jgi:hypothetical protein
MQHLVAIAGDLRCDHPVGSPHPPGRGALGGRPQLYVTERRQPFPSGFEVGRRSRGVEGCEHPYPGDFARWLGLDEERRHEETEGDGKHEPNES